MSYDFDLNEAMDILWFCHKNDLDCCRFKSFDFDLNEAMDILWFCHKNDLDCCRFKSFEYPNSPKFQLVKTQKLSDLC